MGSYGGSAESQCNCLWVLKNSLPEKCSEKLCVESSKEPMRLDPQIQGDARSKKHADVCNGYLPTELANEEERKMGCAECCDCWCHGNFSNEDGTDREDAEALRAEIRRLNLESAVILEMKKKGQLN